MAIYIQVGQYIVVGEHLDPTFPFFVEQKCISIMWGRQIREIDKEIILTKHDEKLLIL